MIIPRWQISAGEISEWLPPVLFALATLISAWVFCDARRRLSFYAVAAWTLATLVAPPIVLPLYLFTRLFSRHAREPAAAAPLHEPPHRDDVLNELQEGCAPGSGSARETLNPVAVRDALDELGTRDAGNSTPPFLTAPPALPPAKKLRAVLRSDYTPPFIYALVALSLGAAYFYHDYRSFDAHLARAARSQLVGPPATTIRLYREALRLSDDAHTHKLLALELAADHQPEAALTEFRAAERLGEPDALLPYHIAHALEALGRPAEATTGFRKFAGSDWCARPQPDPRCAEAQNRARH